MPSHAVVVQVEQGHDPRGRAVCTCGWTGPLQNFDLLASMDGERHLVEAPLVRGNACRYCFAPIADEKPLYCSESCERADRRRPDPDALADVLDAHSEALTPSPDQLEMW